jgi:hypothetical protein
MTAADEQHRLREHAARWAEYGPQLDAIRKRALQAQSEEEHRKVIQDVLAGPVEWFRQGTRPDSGLVEQQRIFAKICPR